MNEYVRVPKADWISILDTTRAKAGYSGEMVSGEVSAKIDGIQSGGGSGGPLQAKTAYPSHSEQIIAPDEDYYGLVSVTVKPVPKLPACVVSVAEDIANVVENVVNIGVAVSVTATDYTE